MPADAPAQCSRNAILGMQGWEGAGLERKSCISGSHASPKGARGSVGCCSSGSLSAVAARPFCPMQHPVFTMWWELSDGGTCFVLHHNSNLLESEHPRCGAGKSRGNGMASRGGQAEPRPLSTCLTAHRTLSPSGLASPRQTVEAVRPTRASYLASCSSCSSSCPILASRAEIVALNLDLTAPSSSCSLAFSSLFCRSSC